MPREVSDEEYNFLQGRKQVADFVESFTTIRFCQKKQKR